MAYFPCAQARADYQQLSVARVVRTSDLESETSPGKNSSEWKATGESQAQGTSPQVWQLCDCLSESQNRSLECQTPLTQTGKADECRGLMQGTKDKCPPKGGSCLLLSPFSPKGSYKSRLDVFACIHM